MITIVDWEYKTYNGVVYRLPILDYGGESLCNHCGKCCWNFKGEFSNHQCEHLNSANLMDCDAYGTGEIYCEGLTCDWPQPRHFVDLPDDCGYVIYWKANGMLLDIVEGIAD